MVNRFGKRFPFYPDDSDYNTNANSYYDDLARKSKLIKLLSERIWEYENTLDESLEQIEKRLTDYILENDSLMNERLENWDKRIEEMPEEMRSLFVIWLEDGTLEQIINHDVLGNKADQSDLDETNTQVAQNKKNIKDISINISDYKTENNNWNEAFELAYDDLPQYGGVILIPETITIQRSINLHDLGSKKVMIEGNYSNLNNPSTTYNSIIIKQGNFDAVELNHGSGMRNIGVSRDMTFTDTHDGIYVNGITCTLENVGVNNQGGDGIRIGSKKIDEDSVHRNCNIGRFTNVRSVGNKGWGVVTRDDFSTGINTSDANAGVYIAFDVRDNDLGGMLFEKCIDNYVYSPDCEVNRGDAGIKVGEETSGIHIYSAYTENHGCLHDIWLTSGSSYCIVIGYRSGTLNDRIENESTTNFVLGKYTSKFGGYIFTTPQVVPNLKIGTKTSIGYFSFLQNELNELEIISAGGASKAVRFKDDSGDPLTLVTGALNIGPRDRLNSIRVRPSSTSTETVVPAKTSISKAINNVNDIAMGDFLIANPTTMLPSGISYYPLSLGDDTCNIVFINSTDTSITIPQTTWKVLGISGLALS